jgi:hypothetical protein
LFSDRNPRLVTNLPLDVADTLSVAKGDRQPKKEKY